MNELDSQKELIESKDWDVLIVLDACRYDCFKKYYREFFEGTLKKVESEGSCTKDWLNKTFGNIFWGDVVYISATPYVNSKQVDIVGFDGTKHFGKILDAWKDGWNDDLKTVLPKKVGKITRMARAKYPGDRIISHFMQPHYPYFSIGPVDEGISTAFSYANGKKMREEVKYSTVSERLRRFLGGVMINSFGWKFTQRVRKELGLINEIGNRHISKIAKEYGENKLKKAYRDNLKKGFYRIKETINHLPDEKIVITADHGELLGEEGIYGHPCDCGHSVLREVPWLEVD